MAKSTSPVVGIDLGTTFSCVAHYNQGKAEVIADQKGDRIIPSIVFYDPKTGTVYVGKIVHDLYAKCPGNALRDIKRIIGRRYDDEFLKEYRKLNETHFSIVKGDNDLAAFEVIINGEKIIKTPEEVSSEILKYLKNAASTFLGAKVEEAVISVPAYFSNSQRKATKKAAELAGLTVLKLITEPIAGAIYYSKDKSINGKSIVVDWGGGTLDVSFIQVNNKILEVKAVSGDTLLGGRNIDEILFKHFYDESYINDPRRAMKFIRRLLMNCINLKEHLSTMDEITKIIDCAKGDEDLTLFLTRDQFELLTEKIFIRVMDIIEVGILEAGWKKSDVTNVILIGGSTRIHRFSTMLKLFFGETKLKTDLNPDEAVARGASIQAALLKYNKKELEKYRITEVTPLSLGTSTSENLFVKLIKKNSRLPASGQSLFETAKNNQSSMLIDIFEGERKDCKHNNKLGEFSVNDLPLHKAGDVDVLIKFNLDEDGILTVTAKEKKSNKENSLQVAMGEFWLSGRNIKISIEEAQNHKIEDDLFEEFALKKHEIVKKCNHLLIDLAQISVDNDRNLGKTLCEEFLTQIEQLEYTKIKDLTKSFDKLNDSISGLLRTYRIFVNN